MTIQSPIPDFAAARAAMVESQLRPQGVTDFAVLAAMGRVPREIYLPAHTRPLAYVDRAVAIGDGRFLASPGVLGQLLDEIEPRPGELALVVGAGTGYSAAILTAIGLEVVAVESDPALAEQARANGADIFEAPLTEGHAAAAPYDVILIDGAVEAIPTAIIGQLGDGGRLGTGIVDRGVTRLVVGRKSGGAFGTISIGDAGIPILPGFSSPQVFTF